MRIDGQRALVREREHVAVRRSLGAHCRADVALRTAAIVDDDLLAPLLGKFCAEHAPQRVGAAARRERHDQAHRFVRIGRRCARSGYERKRQDERNQHALHHASPQSVHYEYGLAPDSLTICAYLSISRATNAANSAGMLATGSAPSLCMKAFDFACWRPFTTSA